MGQDGPYAAMAGDDINYLALSGALHGHRHRRHTGAAAEPRRRLRRRRDTLLAVGMLSVWILEARQSGTGQVLDVAMIDGAAS